MSERELTYRAAINEALHLEMRRDESVFIMGEDIAGAPGRDDPEMIDTVITLYDGSMNQIAENDDAIPRFNTDSELVIHVPAAGTYYVEVQEFSDWAGEDPEGMAPYFMNIASDEALATAGGNGCTTFTDASEAVQGVDGVVSIGE